VITHRSIDSTFRQRCGPVAQERAGAMMENMQSDECVQFGYDEPERELW
jgi:hypothetical protein